MGILFPFSSMAFVLMKEKREKKRRGKLHCINEVNVVFKRHVYEMD